mgnify:CR=1 FL=1
MHELLLIILANGLVNNVVLSRFLGLCSFMGVTNKIESAIGMSMATTFVITVSSCVSWVLNYAVLDPLGLGYLRLISFIMVIASLVQLTELFVAKYSPELYRTLGIFLPLITTNCAVLGIAVINMNEDYSLLKSIVNALGSSLGFLLAIVLMAGIRYRLERNDLIPKHLRGLPLALVTAGLMSIAAFVSTLLGPPSVTVHDNRHVLGYPV